MYAIKIQELITEVRNRIEAEPGEKYRIALMYQFLTGTEISQVSGEHRPNGNDIIKTTIFSNSQPLTIIICKIKPNRKKENIRFALLPVDNSSNDWVNIVQSYFLKFQSETPFKFYENTRSSKRDLQAKAKVIFEGLDWDFPAYSTSKTGKIGERTKPFTSDALRKLRLNDLIINYDFNSLDLALFNGFNDKSRLLSYPLKDILEEKLTKYSEDELVERAFPYLTKFIKKKMRQF